MTELVHSLGIDWKVMIAQLINFAILFFVLKKFAVGPVMKMLEKREARIREQQNAGEIIAAKLGDIDRQKEDILNSARRESQKIIRDAENSAERLREEMQRSAEREAGKIIMTGKRQVEDERLKAETELKKEIGELIALSVEKAVGNAIDKRAHTALVDEAKAILMARNHQN